MKLKTNYDKLHDMSKMELAKFLHDNIEQYDSTPWERFFSENYCENCESITVTVCEPNFPQSTQQAAWCELKHKCRYFQEMDDIPDVEQTILMWLESEADE